MHGLRAQVGYVSLKTKHMEKMAKNFPSLPGFDADFASNMDEDDSCDIVPINPLEEKDRQIAVLESKVKRLTEGESEVSCLKDNLAKITAELEKVKSSYKTSLKKLSFTQKATEKRILESIANPEGFTTDPVLIGVFSATLDEDEFKFESESGKDDSNRSRKDTFLKSMEE